MPRSTSITVHGIAAPQGSKGPWGAEANKRTKPWRETVAQVVGEAWAGAPLLRGPVGVRATFMFPRPKGHYGTGRNSATLKPTAPTWHTAPNDLDKLLRAVGDALTGVVWADDRQVCEWFAQKVYGEAACLRLTIVDLSGGSDDTGSDARAREGSE